MGQSATSRGSKAVRSFSRTVQATSAIAQRQKLAQPQDHMDESIARANIDHFRKLLETEKDESKRHTLLLLLAEEDIKLKAARDAKPKKS